jgi:hypothetical protein
MIRVLIGCEKSGSVRSAFRDRGYLAFSCDLVPADDGGPHIVGNVLDVIGLGWDLVIIHPPCTYLCSSGLHWNQRPEGIRNNRAAKTDAALGFVRDIFAAPVQRLALENPVGCIGSRIRLADQYIQPFEFGDDASKKTGLWLRGLPRLVSTNYVSPRFVDGRPRWSNQTDSGQNKEPPAENRGEIRSVTYPGIATAMADQWGRFVMSEVFEKSVKKSGLLFA